MTKPGGKRRGRPAGTDYFTKHPESAAAVEAWIAGQALAAPRIMELLRATFPETPLPGIATLRRYITHLEDTRPALLAAMRDPDNYRSQYRLALGRADGSVTRAHQVWEIDTTKSDVMCKGGKVAILGLIDRYSRMARFIVDTSESGQSVRRLLIDAIQAWGVMPEALMTDNGSGYINQSIVSALDMLGIEHRLCPPGSPWKKPYIERVFGTFTRERTEFLKGYAGHNVAEAQRLRAKAKKETGRAVIVPELEPEALQAILTGWTEGTYHRRKHSSLKRSPAAQAQMSPVPARRAPDADTLRMALSKAEGSYTVGKKGVRWKGVSYWSAALVLYSGRQVHVRRDEDNLGELLIFDEDGRFIDIAVNHERTGLSEEEFSIRANRRMQADLAEAKRRVRQNQKRYSMEDAVQEILREEAEAAGKLVSLPRPTAPFSTATIDSLKNAPDPAVPSAAELQRAVERLTPKAAPAVRSVADKVAEADVLIAAAARGEAVDEAALRRARLYAGGTEYRAEKLVQTSFTPPATHQKRNIA